MASARGDALDWALALARAPGERFALRQQPLPDGVDSVLQIAGGSNTVAIEEAAARVGGSSVQSELRPERVPPRADTEKGGHRKGGPALPRTRPLNLLAISAPSRRFAWPDRSGSRRLRSPSVPSRDAR